MQRYFVDKKINNKFVLSNNDIHHIKNVMRMKVNDNIEIIFKEKLYICKITNINNVDLEIIKEEDIINELPKHITIAFSISKEDKIDLILQKCTELGIYEFIPLETERCTVKINKEKENKKIDRWQMICKEASEQSKRNVIPKVLNIHKLKELINLDYDLKILCSVNRSVINIKEVLKKQLNCDRIIFVIGPEGGLSNNEEEILINNDFIPTSLGSRTLRMETAPIMIGSILNYEFME